MMCLEATTIGYITALMICHNVYFYTKLSKYKAVYKQHLNHKVLAFGGTGARENAPCQKYKRLYLENGE